MPRKSHLHSPYFGSFYLAALLAAMKQDSITKAFVNAISLGCVITTFSACDPEHKKKCEWFLVPDQARIGKVHEGYIPVCARNLVVNKEDCRLQAQLKFTEQNYGRKFRYIDMAIDGPGIPRTITDIAFCSKEMAMFEEEETSSGKSRQ